MTVASLLPTVGRATRRGAASPSLVLAWAIVAVVVLWAVLPGVFTHYSAVSGTPQDRLLPPSAEHWFGTDQLGRDQYARIVYGSVHSLAGAVVAVLVGFVAGSLLGLVAGSLGGVVDSVVGRVVDVLLSVPGLLLSLTVIILLGFGTVHAAIAVGLTSIASFTRLTRSEVVSVRRSEFVEAAFGSGGRALSVLFRHVLPNSLGPVLALVALQIGTAIIAISTLGFLGYGAPPPTPEWGLLIADGRNYVATSWWLTTFPGLVVVLVVLSANRIGQSLGQRRNGRETR